MYHIKKAFVHHSKIKAMKVQTTHLAYFVKYRPTFLFKDYIKRKSDAGFPRIILPSKSIEILNSNSTITVHLSGILQRDMYIWRIARERNGSLSGFIEDLKQTGEKVLFLGDEHQIRFLEREFLNAGIRILRYEVGTQSVISEKICYIAEGNRIIPIEEELICVA